MERVNLYSNWKRLTISLLTNSRLGNYHRFSWNRDLKLNDAILCPTAGEQLP